jgi:hypothetical protein
MADTQACNTISFLSSVEHTEMKRAHILEALGLAVVRVADNPAQLSNECSTLVVPDADLLASIHDSLLIVRQHDSLAPRQSLLWLLLS